MKAAAERLRGRERRKSRKERESLKGLPASRKGKKPELTMGREDLDENSSTLRREGGGPPTAKRKRSSDFTTLGKKKELLGVERGRTQGQSRSKVQTFSNPFRKKRKADDFFEEGEKRKSSPAAIAIVC